MRLVALQQSACPARPTSPAPDLAPVPAVTTEVPWRLRQGVVERLSASGSVGQRWLREERGHDSGGGRFGQVVGLEQGVDCA